MRIAVRMFASVVMCLALLCSTSGTLQARDTSHVDTDKLFSDLKRANFRVLGKLHESRRRVKIKLHALGARLKTVAKWRAKWTKEGKTERVARYLDGRAANQKLWYLAQSKANKERMAQVGLGHINIGYIDHWHKFNELTDTYNKLTKYIVKLQLKRMKRDIADMRARVAALNDSYKKQSACVQQVKAKVKSMQATVDEMLSTVKTQSLGLEMLLTYLRGMERGLSDSANAAG